MFKVCKICGVEKDISEFYSGRKDCKDCKNAAARDKWKNDTEARNRYLVRMRARTKERRYGITQEQFNQMVIDQNNKCIICSCDFRSTKDTHIDHCHATAKVRGLLCNGCNVGLGQFNDDIDLLRNAIKYLVD